MAEAVLQQADGLMARREREAFEKAEKVAAKDWRGEYVWSDRFEEIFDDIGELLERYAAANEEPPEYVWECEREDLEIDADDVIGDAIERSGLNDLHVEQEAREELKTLLGCWMRKHQIHWWRQAHKRAVLLREGT